MVLFVHVPWSFSHRALEKHPLVSSEQTSICWRPWQCFKSEPHLPALLDGVLLSPQLFKSSSCAKMPCALFSVNFMSGLHYGWIPLFFNTCERAWDEAELIAIHSSSTEDMQMLACHYTTHIVMTRYISVWTTLNMHIRHGSPLIQPSRAARNFKAPGLCYWKEIYLSHFQQQCYFQTNYLTSSSLRAAEHRCWAKATQTAGRGDCTPQTEHVSLITRVVASCGRLRASVADAAVIDPSISEAHTFARHCHRTEAVETR